MIKIRMRKFRFILLAFAVSVLQQSLMHRFSYGYLGIDLIGLLAAFAALSTTAGSALWAGLFLGLLRDLGSIGRLGASALSILPAVMLVRALKERFHRRNLISDITLTFLFLLCSGILYRLGLAVAASGGPIYSSWLGYALGNAALTVLLVPPFFALFRISGVIEERKTTF